MTIAADAVGRTRRFNTRRIAPRHGWTIGVFVLLVLLIIAYASSARTGGVHVVRRRSRW